MLKRLSRAIQRASSGRVTLVALAVFLAFTALVLPRQAASADAATGGAGAPDTAFFYSAEDLYAFAEAYGPDGRAAYVRARFTFDVAWPAVYTFFLATALSWLGRRAFAPVGPWGQVNLVPLLAALFDLLENASTSLVMARYPALTPGVATVAPFFSSVKWLFVAGSFALLPIVAGLALWRRSGRPKESR